jgi:uncharacterized membrane protein (UPF0136 family)
VTTIGAAWVVLAHGGPGSTWQAMVVVAGLVLGVVFVLAAIGRITITSRDDLLLPIAAAAIASSLGVIGHELISDGIGWGLPLAVVTLAALALAAFTPLDLRFPAPLPMIATALALVSMVLLYRPLTIALHPPAELLPLADDSDISIAAPADGDELPAGTVEVLVEVAGGSIGPGVVPLEELPDDPEEAGTLLVSLVRLDEDGSVSDQVTIDPDTSACTLETPCSSVAFDIEVDAGDHRLIVEFVRGDGVPLAPFVRDQVTFTTS